MLVDIPAAEPPPYPWLFRYMQRALRGALPPYPSPPTTRTTHRGSTLQKTVATPASINTLRQPPLSPSGRSTSRTERCPPPTRTWGSAFPSKGAFFRDRGRPPNLRMVRLAPRNTTGGHGGVGGVREADGSKLREGGTSSSDTKGAQLHGRWWVLLWVAGKS